MQSSGVVSALARLPEAARRKTHAVGHLPHEELRALVQGAAVLAYPSGYEGFGLPVAQAMAAGAPVITSNVSSLPEVAGDAALLVDPRSVAEVGAALEKALLSPALRGEMSDKGRRRAQEYRWDVCARKSWKFFERL